MTKKLPAGTKRTGITFWKENGFANFEAHALKKTSYESVRNEPHLKQLVNLRKWYKSYFVGYKGYTTKQYEARIKQLYVDKGWIEKGPRGNKYKNASLLTPESKESFNAVWGDWKKKDPNTGVPIGMVSEYRSASKGIDPKTGKVLGGSGRGSWSGIAQARKDFQDKNPKINKAKSNQIVSLQRDAQNFKWMRDHAKSPAEKANHQRKLDFTQQKIDDLMGDDE